MIKRPHPDEMRSEKSPASQSGNDGPDGELRQDGCEIGAAFRRIFEQYLDRVHVRIDKRLAAIVAAACQLSTVGSEARQKRNSSPVVTSIHCRCILQVCLPELDNVARAKLAEIILNDHRELAPLLEFAYSKLAQINSNKERSI